MEKYDVRFKKRLGQNFLRDNSIVKRIVDISGVGKNSLVIEVGPGGAILTRELAYNAKNVLAYEIDVDLENELSAKLSEFDNVDILFQDFLGADLKNDIDGYKFDSLFFVSNVPYYITTPIIIKLIQSGLHFDNIVMMVQKEVGDRFSTTCGCRDYGSITVLLNYFFEIKKEFFVSRKEFIPEPKVDSVVVSFRERNDKLFVKDFNFFQTVVHDSFQFKRKNIKNNLFKYDLKIVKDVLSKHGYDLSVRAENLDVSTFVEISNALLK